MERVSTPAPLPPRFLIAAPQSHSGKTTVMLAVLAALSARGLSVAPFKAGPDYIDPGHYESACGRRGCNLDTWLMPPASVKSLFARQCAGSDAAVVEGVMGLYDGGAGNAGSTSEIAKLLGLPVVLVIDVKAMAGSAAALALGFKVYDPGVNLAGVILNRLGSPSHEAMIRGAMDRVGIPVFGALPRDGAFTLEERHLGLVPAEERAERDVFRLLGEAAERHIDLDGLLKLGAGARNLPPERDAKAASSPAATIGVALDKAFSFYYADSLAELERQGARLVYFSPLEDGRLPECDGLIFGGGYPEVFTAELERNESFLASLRSAARRGVPVYAECGGLMYLTREISDFSGRSFKMAGLIPARAVMKQKLQMVGYVEARTLLKTALGPSGTVLRGHEFHFSVMEPDSGTAENFPWAFEFTRTRTGGRYASGYACGNVLASYLHLHFAGSPQVAGHFIQSCRSQRERINSARI